MKKIMFVLFMLSCFHLKAGNWLDTWTMAIEMCHEQKYDEAGIKLNEAISEMEEENNVDFPEVYVDRARLYLKKEQFELVLPDLEKAISTNKLSEEQLTRAITTRISAKSNLGIEDGILEDLAYIGARYCPDMKHTEKYIIMRKVPDCECFRNTMTCFFIHSGICKSKDDIKMLDSGICIIKKSCSCGCKECEDKAQQEKECDACGEHLKRSLDLCTGACDTAVIPSTNWCAKTFASWQCKTACYAAIVTMQQTCHYCCSEGNPYKKCVLPFKNLAQSVLSIIGEGCDPMWD